MKGRLQYILVAWEKETEIIYMSILSNNLWVMSRYSCLYCVTLTWTPQEKQVMNGVAESGANIIHKWKCFFLNACLEFFFYNVRCCYKVWESNWEKCIMQKIQLIVLRIFIVWTMLTWTKKLQSKSL